MTHNGILTDIEKEVGAHLMKEATRKNKRTTWEQETQHFTRSYKEIVVLYSEAARALIGAMLREPHMYNSFRIPAVWFQDTAYHAIAEGIEAVIRISAGKIYTPNAVRIQSGVRQAEISELLTDHTPIDLAYELFVEKHELYIELLCAEVVDRETNAHTIQSLQKQIRSERLVLREGEMSEKEDLMTWAIAKLEGHDPTYPTTPHLKTLTENNVIRHCINPRACSWQQSPLHVAV